MTALSTIAARENPPDLVIARVEEGGRELLRQMRDLARDDPRTRGIPVLLIGGPESEASCLAAMEEGACDFLIEPFSPRTLAARVAICLRGVRDRRESLLRERDLLAENQMAAEALVRSEERFQAFLRNSPVASWMTDEEARVVFLSEPFYAEREALVDGQRVTPVHANLAFTAVPVPAGSHQLELRYAPTSFRLGLGLSVLTVVVWTGLSRRRRPR